VHIRADAAMENATWALHAWCHHLTWRQCLYSPVLGGHVTDAFVLLLAFNINGHHAVPQSDANPQLDRKQTDSNSNALTCFGLALHSTSDTKIPSLGCSQES